MSCHIRSPSLLLLEKHRENQISRLSYGFDNQALRQSGARGGSLFASKSSCSLSFFVLGCGVEGKLIGSLRLPEKELGFPTSPLRPAASLPLPFWRPDCPLDWKSPPCSSFLSPLALALALASTDTVFNPVAFFLAFSLSCC